MTVLYVDTEHDLVLDDPERGPAHHAKVGEAQARLAAAAGGPCFRVRFADVSPAQVARLAPTAIVIGGSTADWTAYDVAMLTGLLQTIRVAPVPILGICAGHQLVGLAHGAPWGPLGGLQEGEVDPDPRFVPGQRKQRGFLPVWVDQGCPLFRGLEPAIDVFQSHYWQLEDVPRGFVARARSPWSAIQAIERLDRPVFGVQFHPERHDAAHPHGEVVLRNFFALSRTRGADDTATHRGVKSEPRS